MTPEHSYISTWARLYVAEPRFQVYVCRLRPAPRDKRLTRPIYTGGVLIDGRPAGRARDADNGGIGADRRAHASPTVGVEANVDEMPEPEPLLTPLDD